MENKDLTNKNPDAQGESPPPTPNRTSEAGGLTQLPSNMTHPFLERGDTGSHRGYIPGGSPENPLGPLLVHIAGTLREKGLNYHMRQALLTLLAMASAHLDNPFSLFIASEPGSLGIRFLNAVGNLVPESMKVEFSRLNRKIFHQNCRFLAGKVVLVFDFDAIKSGKEIFRVLLERGLVTDHYLATDGGRRRVERVDIQGPTSIVALVTLPEPDWLTRFPGLRISLDSSPDYVREVLQRNATTLSGNQLMEASAGIISTEMARLSPLPVSIPFRDQIVSSLDVNDPASTDALDIIEKLLNIITILNHATYSTPAERDCAFYGIKPRRTLSTPEAASSTVPRLPSPGPGGEEAGILQATKVEYYIFHRIAAEFLPRRTSQLSSRQQRIANAVWAINERFLRSGTIFFEMEQASPREIIEVLEAQAHLRGWASIDEILETLGADGSEPLSKSTVDRELIELWKHQRIITRRKDIHVPNKYRYVIADFPTISANTLPDPSDIQDPVFQGREVTIWDPISDQNVSF